VSKVIFIDLAVTADGENLMPPRESAFGSIHAAITDETKISFFQPTNINFSHLPEPPEFAGFAQHERIDKNAKRTEQVARAKASFTSWLTHTPSFARAQNQSLVERASAELSSLSTPM
jgi:folate-dependent tRNA-U54 methylase TrmFO/GidA